LSANSRRGVPRNHAGERLAETYSAADVFVFPSKTDTFGLVLLEALASGVPVAALPVPGPLDVIGDAPVGALNNDLRAACFAALDIPRDACREFAASRSWGACAQAFIENVTRERPPQVKRRWRRRLARRLRLTSDTVPTT
jgi:glycosyltransferase involved in cell wall biosynthesis